MNKTNINLFKPKIVLNKYYFPYSSIFEINQKKLLLPDNYYTSKQVCCEKGLACQIINCQWVKTMLLKKFFLLLVILIAFANPVQSIAGYNDSRATIAANVGSVITKLRDGKCSETESCAEVLKVVKTVPTNSIPSSKKTNIISKVVIPITHSETNPDIINQSIKHINCPPSFGRSINPLCYKVNPVFNWSMADRFGLDTNNNGLIDLPNTRHYVYNVPPSEKIFGELTNAKFSITLNASSRVRNATNIDEYQWTIIPTSDEMTSDINWPLTYKRTSPKLTIDLAEGEYDVTLRITAKVADPQGRKSCSRQLTPPRSNTGINVRTNPISQFQRIFPKEKPFCVYLDYVSVTKSLTQEVTIEDILIVSIGDSVSSGEGNPEKSKRFISEEIGCFGKAVYWADDGISSDSSTKICQLPDQMLWSDATTDIAKQHVIAHRSTLAWPAQVALALEKRDSHTSVTFVSFAATGATIDKGLLGEHSGSTQENIGIDGTDHWNDYRPSLELQPQLERVENIVGSRGIDVLLISIGGNDIGFVPILTALAIHDTFGVGGDKSEIIDEAINSGNWGKVHDAFGKGYFWDFDELDFDHLAGLGGLEDYFDLLYHEISNYLNVKNTYLIEYPDPTKRKTTVADVMLARFSGDPMAQLPSRYYLEMHPYIFCDQMLKGVGRTNNSPDASIDRGEVKWLYNHAFKPLNTKLQSIANSLGWKFVGGIADDFAKGHGICAERPYDPEHYPGNPYPNAVNITSGRWFRTGKASLSIQGPFSIKKTRGTMHPNESGHQIIKRHVLNKILQDL